ncbi:IclR family transcriptional regulator [Granulosicoccus antarcticus]|uniref:HTH-type transcriptional regulator TsaQ1/TsaQ2 n=1 Tax=Granulosicoccus antarcticus IMCC3135 TaxID=1192854 RepID=A0A2Z2NQE9_9GAMM|nr:IclR family transcriptional regulator [Granulosicoccus antarcticus]ASJ73459.1 HTH-type transcriptional regulator TsaQ1/TsaQ2 [Granulosicoccus antarcticus IMCC3135]
MTKKKSSGKTPSSPSKAEPGTAPKASRSAVSLIYDNDDISERLSKDRKFNWSLARGLEMLRAFSVRPSPLGNSELSEITQVPKATVTRLTHTLTELGYLSYNQRLGKFEPAPAILALGYPVLTSMKARVVAREHLQKLAEEVNLPVALAARDRLSMIYVDACQPSTMMTMHLDIGSRVDMATTALGRAFMWGISEGEQDYVFSLLEKRHGTKWPKLKASIKKSFAQIEKRGFCIVDGEWQRDIRAVGVPLVSSDGATVMAFNAAGPQFAASLETLETIVGPRLVHLSKNVASLVST